jgi:hypothetical protein
MGKKCGNLRLGRPSSQRRETACGLGVAEKSSVEEACCSAGGCCAEANNCKQSGKSVARLRLAKKPKRFKGEQEALIDEVLFTRVQSLRRDRSHGSTKLSRVFLLTGFAVLRLRFLDDAALYAETT